MKINFGQIIFEEKKLIKKICIRKLLVKKKIGQKSLAKNVKKHFGQKI